MAGACCACCGAPATSSSWQPCRPAPEGLPRAILLCRLVFRAWTGCYLLSEFTSLAMSLQVWPSVPISIHSIGYNCNTLSMYGIHQIIWRCTFALRLRCSLHRAPPTNAPPPLPAAPGWRPGRAPPLPLWGDQPGWRPGSAAPGLIPLGGSPREICSAAGEGRVWAMKQQGSLAHLAPGKQCLPQVLADGIRVAAAHLICRPWPRRCSWYPPASWCSSQPSW
jgi:hypothetical protein